jgi:predicted O-linked N-acetylglucosamine transferase (SPINDLY family)
MTIHQSVQQTLQQAAYLHRSGRFIEAEAAYRSVLAGMPRHVDALHGLGLLKFQQGQLNEACELLRRAVRESPKSSAVRSSLGSVLAALRCFDEALACFDTVLKRDPRDAAARYNRAVVLDTLARNEEALAEFDKVLKQRHDDADAWFNRGNVLARVERYEEALTSYDHALAIAPRAPSIINNRGVVLSRLDRHEEALASFDSALAINPQYVDALNNRAIALRELERYDEALACCDQALAIRPNHVDSRITRGVVLVKKREYKDAVSEFERALGINPNEPEAHHNLGVALTGLNRWTEALACYDNALRLRPRYAVALSDRGMALTKFGRFAEALASYDAALAVKPNDADYLNSRAYVLGKLGRYCEAIVSCRQALAADREHPHALSHLSVLQLSGCDWAETDDLATRLDRAMQQKRTNGAPFLFLALPTTPAEQLKYTRACVARMFENYRATVLPPKARAARSDGRIRVLYLSADFHQHATAALMARLFECHDRSRFEIIAISIGSDDQSEMRSRLVKAFDRFYDVRFQSDEEVSELLYELDGDIAVDLKGHTEDSRPQLLAGRPAPIQVSYLGYPGTMAVDFIDYIIADPIVLPFDQEPYYTEKIVHLPDGYQVNDSTRKIADWRPSRSELGLPEQGFVFCCFNQSYKIAPHVFDVWMRLLKQVDRAVLWLLASNDAAVANLRKEAAARGVDPKRLVFAPRLELSLHLARHRAADLFLDTLPYNAHTTASDALWAGLPVLTCMGTTFAGRVAASLLHAIGLPELVTHSLEEYEALAVKLASDPAMLRSIRQKLEQNRLTQPLFDTDRFRRHIEAAYTTMWEIWQRGEKPKSFAVEPISSPPPRGAGRPR